MCWQSSGAARKRAGARRLRGRPRHRGPRTCAREARYEGVDLIVFNDVSRDDIGFDATENEVVMVWPTAASAPSARHLSRLDRRHGPRRGRTPARVSTAYEDYQEGWRRLRAGRTAQATVPLEKARRAEPTRRRSEKRSASRTSACGGGKMPRRSSGRCWRSRPSTITRTTRSGAASTSLAETPKRRGTTSSPGR